MIETEYTKDELLMMETLNKVKQIKITKDNLNLLNRCDILFIMVSDENMDFFDKYKVYYTMNKYDRNISEDDIFTIIPELKTASYDYQKDFIGINLGLGHALLIRSEIYNDYMKILKSDILYEDEFDIEQLYAAWNHWIDCAIKYINIKNMSL